MEMNFFLNIYTYEKKVYTKHRTKLVKFHKMLQLHIVFVLIYTKLFKNR